MIHKIIKVLSLLLVLACIIALFADICTYPERYFSTWRYQLEQEVRAGEPEATEYYERNYVARGIVLFE